MKYRWSKIKNEYENEDGDSLTVGSRSGLKIIDKRILPAIPQDIESESET